MAEPAQQEPLSIQRAVSVEVIKNTGGFAVKARPGQKEPAKGWDPRANNPAKSAQTLSQIEFSNDNIGVHLHGPLVDVDIDSDSPYLQEALDDLLPNTPHIWGRNSRPRTHRLYQLRIPETNFDPTKFPILRRIKRIEEVKCEIRGGPISRGEYSLLPGSTHPSGEKYEWANIGEARATPVVVEPIELISAVRRAGAIAVLAPIWTEGLRQEFTMALAGFLHRAQAITLSIDPEADAIDLNSGLDFLETLMSVSGDDPSDRIMRRKAFEATWKKADKSLPVTGATTIAKFIDDESVVRKLYTLLSDNPSVETIDEFSSQFVIWKGPALAIDLELVSKGESRPFMSRRQFASSYGHKFVETTAGRKLLPEMLWSLSSATRVYGLTFEPSLEDQLVDSRAGIKVNQWTGFNISPSQDPTDVDRFVEYVLHVVCSSDPELFHWVMSWCADIFQHPGDKPGTALVLVGTEGVGKSILGHQILGPIIGDGHYATTNNVDNLTRNFNIAFTNKILIQADEAMNSRQRAHANKMKSLITDPRMIVEPKGVDQYSVPAHARFFLTSNEIYDAVHLSAGSYDRRYTVVEVGTVKRGQVEEYWRPFVAWLKSPNVLASIHRYFKEYQYDKHEIQLPIRTEAKTIMQQHSWDAVDSWLASMLARSHPLSERSHTKHWHSAVGTGPIKKNHINREWPMFIYASALREDYRAHMRELGRFASGAHMNEWQLQQLLKKKGVVTDGSGRRAIADEYDERLGQYVRRKIRLIKAPEQDRIEKYLINKHGVTSPDVDGDEELEVRE